MWVITPTEYNLVSEFTVHIRMVNHPNIVFEQVVSVTFYDPCVDAVLTATFDSNTY